MNIRFYNARILTMEEGKDIFQGEVRIRDERIEYVGEEKRDEAVPSFDEEIDCGGNLLMPGFKDAHTHSGMTLLRSYADDLPLDKWLNQQVFHIEAKMTGEDVYELTQLGLLENVTTGSTAGFGV